MSQFSQPSKLQRPVQLRLSTSLGLSHACAHSDALLLVSCPVLSFLSLRNPSRELVAAKSTSVDRQTVVRQHGQIEHWGSEGRPPDVGGWPWPIGWKRVQQVTSLGAALQVACSISPVCPGSISVLNSPILGAEKGLYLSMLSNIYQKLVCVPDG
jgi:hypothetical protein